jgi:hypothetical protein
MRRTFTAALLAASLLSSTGCVFAVGSSNDDGRRIQKLEERMGKAEETLGIPSEAKQ